MVLEGGLPAPLQLYAAAAAGLGPRPAWPPFLPFFGVPPPFLARPRLPHPMPSRAPHGPPSEDSNEDGGSSKGKIDFLVLAIQQFITVTKPTKIILKKT